MSESLGDTSSINSRGRGRGRGKSRGGVGKYLRARGRRGYGRPAEFSQRLLLEDESPADEEEEERAAVEIAEKFSRRKLGTNADRYVEQEPELDSDGEPIVEPEVDLSTFLEKQRLSDAPIPSLAPEDVADEDDIDHSMVHISSKPQHTTTAPSRKGKIEHIQWDKQLEEMSQENAAAEATRELKDRFRAKSDKLRKKPTAVSLHARKAETVIEAPALPPADGVQPKPKAAKQEMEDFLDDLLS
ncbi:hypothetical protein BDQ17DRAFT_1389208 [Cyathus striatus]|nr:hypothetical protein BDQ17DRAFT_1389208 [Cyathus striatus]